MSLALSRIFAIYIFAIQARETNVSTCTFKIFTSGSPLILRQGPGSQVLDLTTKLEIGATCHICQVVTLALQTVTF